MAHIDYFFGTFSPNVYLAGTRMEAAAARHGATIAYRPLDLMALFARTGGVPPAQRHENRQVYRMQELRRQAVKLGMPMNLKPAHFPTNPAPSSYAVIGAQASGQGGDLGALVAGLARSCWAEEKDIAEDAVIKACLDGAGFDPSLADSGLLAGAEAYAQNLEDAVSLGAFGSPFYVVADADERFWGQDRIEDLDAYLASRA